MADMLMLCYLRQGGYVIVVVCLFVCLSVCLLATLQKNFHTDLHEIFRERWQWSNEQMSKFCWRYGSRIRIRITTLVRRALAEVCTVAVLLVTSLCSILLQLFSVSELTVQCVVYVLYWLDVEQ